MEFKHYSSQDQWDRELADCIEISIEDLVRLLEELREAEVE